MTAQRRLEYNFALQHAVALSRELNRPLLVLEALRCDYPWASARLHRFVLDGMVERAGQPGHLPYVEPAPGAGRGLLAALAARACAIVTDDYPCFFLPAMLQAAARQCNVPMLAVDSCGLLPIRSATSTCQTAVAFRRHMQREIAGHLEHQPVPDPLEDAVLLPPDALPPAVRRRWPHAEPGNVDVARLPVDQSVAPVHQGGSRAARQQLRQFVRDALTRYAEDRNQVEDCPASGLSPWLHFGHLSAHEVFAAVASHEGWQVRKLGKGASGRRAGFWGMSAGAEAFLDQLVTWRELGFHYCARKPEYASYASLPAWARATLEKHARDPRPHLYRLEQLDAAATHDTLWNAAQRQLVREGTMHNYLRMLWGKKILQWSASPQEALHNMIHLNNRYALDGRDPNSYSGIFWCLGRFDRPWGPERPIFGNIRYMTSENTARKLNVRAYLQRYGA